MSSPRITYGARDDATPDDELNALAAVYRFVIERKQARVGEDCAGKDATEEIEDGCDATENNSR